MNATNEQTRFLTLAEEQKEWDRHARKLRRMFPDVDDETIAEALGQRPETLTCCDEIFTNVLDLIAHKASRHDY